MAASESGSAGDLPGRINELAQPIAVSKSIDLVDVEVKGQGNRRIVRLVADAEGGLDVDRIASLSREVADLLEEHDTMEGAYTLEVTSPGADRPLRTERDFSRNVGRDVRIVRSEAAAEDAETAGEVTGELVAVADGAVTVEVDGTPTVVAISDIDHGKVVLPW